MNLADGEGIARGIFSVFKAPELLADLLEATRKWRGKAVYLSGERMSPGAIESLAHILKCFVRDRRCQHGNRIIRLQHLGCHLAGIGLLGCSKALLKAGHRFWFHFFDATPQIAGTYHLDRQGLRQSLKTARLCPSFPGNVDTILARLPESVDLNNQFQSRFWMKARGNNTSVGIMPRNMQSYEKWMRCRLEAC
jgi:hypothetical protein